jgi:endonuclease YncB( thermonuclease family)
MKAPSFARLLLSLCAFFCVPSLAVAATLQAKVTEVPSGNTLVVSNINRALKVRLKGIAPPETGQPFSDAAREHLKLLVFDKAVFVEYTDLSNGYLEARVTLNGVDIASQMLRDGVAWYDHTINYGLSDADRELYTSCEQAARAEKRGIWSDANPTAPWEFRRAQQEQLTKIERSSTANAVAPPAKTTRRQKTSLSTADVLGNLFGGDTSSAAPTVRPISENGSPDRWMRIDSAIEHFSISVPSNSVEGSFANADDQGRPISFHFLTGGSFEAFFVFLSAKSPQVALPDDTLADQLINSMITGMNQGASEHGETDRVLTIKSSRPLALNGIAGKEYRLRSTMFAGTARVLTRKVGETQEMFVIFALTRDGGEPLANRFMSSFKLQ